jgi:hypothetical protein
MKNEIVLALGAVRDAIGGISNMSDETIRKRTVRPARPPEAQGPSIWPRTGTCLNIGSD